MGTTARPPAGRNVLAMMSRTSSAPAPTRISDGVDADVVGRGFRHGRVGAVGILVERRVERPGERPPRRTPGGRGDVLRSKRRIVRRVEAVLRRDDRGRAAPTCRRSEPAARRDGRVAATSGGLPRNGSPRRVGARSGPRPRPPRRRPARIAARPSRVTRWTCIQRPNVSTRQRRRRHARRRRSAGRGWSRSRSRRPIRARRRPGTPSPRGGAGAGRPRRRATSTERCSGAYSSANASASSRSAVMTTVPAAASERREDVATGQRRQLARDLRLDRVGQRDRGRDEQGRGVGAVLGLAEQVRRDVDGIGAVVGDDHDLGRSGGHVDGAPVQDLELGRGHPGVARARRSCPPARSTRCRTRGRRSPARRP